MTGWRALLLAGAALVAGCQGFGTTPATAFGALQTQAGQDAAARVDPVRLQDHVKALVAAHRSDPPIMFRTRLPPDFQQFGEVPHVGRASGRYVEDTWRALGHAPAAEEAIQEGIATRNLYVDIAGRSRPSEIVMLTAHHDSWYGGADDNASGVAIVLEAARVLAESAPDRTIRLVAFDGEELGRVGSSHFGSAHDRERVVMLVNLDSVAFASHEAGSQRVPVGLKLPTTGDFLLGLANAPAQADAARFVRLAAGLPRPLSAVGAILPGDGHFPAIRDTLRSDHAWFWRQGVPGLFLTDTANFRNEHYHTASDTFETLDLDFFERVGRAVVAAVAAFARAE